MYFIFIMYHGCNPFTTMQQVFLVNDTMELAETFSLVSVSVFILIKYGCIYKHSFKKNMYKTRNIGRFIND